MLKTRLEILEDNFYTSTLGKILEKEINIKGLRRRLILMKNDPTYAKQQGELANLENGLKNLNNLLDDILELITEEKKKNGKKV